MGLDKMSCGNMAYRLVFHVYMETRHKSFKKSSLCILNLNTIFMRGDGRADAQRKLYKKISAQMWTSLAALKAWNAT